MEIKKLLKRNKNKIGLLVKIVFSMATISLLYFIFSETEISNFTEKFLLVVFSMSLAVWMLINDFVRKNLIKFILFLLLWIISIKDFSISDIAEGNKWEYSSLDFIFKWDIYGGYTAKSQIISLAILFAISNIILLKIFKKMNFLNNYYYFIFMSILGSIFIFLILILKKVK